MQHKVPTTQRESIRECEAACNSVPDNPNYSKKLVLTLWEVEAVDEASSVTISNCIT